LFIDLGGDSSAPVASGEALEWFLLSLGVAACRIPVGESQRTALYRTLTAGRRLAVLLDNAMSARQVRPLIPAGGQSLAAVTSRLRLPGLVMDRARWVDVDPLDTTCSVTLLEGMLGKPRVSAETGAAEDLARLCGGLPLALSIVAARLSTRPHRTLAREVAELQTEDRRFADLALNGDTSVETVLDQSYHDLPGEQRDIYRVCAAHPGREFSVEVAAVVAGWSAERTEFALDRLVEANLLIESGDRRFAYHDLVRLHALRRAEAEDSPADHDNIVRRVIEWYLDRTVAADLVIHPVRPRLGARYDQVQPAGAAFEQARDALAWLELERANLRAALDAAARHYWHELVWRLCEALWGFFLHTRHYGDWIAMHEVGIDSARQCRDGRAEARLRSQLGFAYAKLRRFDDAVTENLKALELAETEHDSQARATALSQLGRAARGKGDLLAALHYFQQARDIQEQLGQTRDVALCQTRIGQILTRLERHSEAVAELLAAASTMRELGDCTQQARTLMMLGTAHRQAGRVAGAYPPLREALALMREFGSPYYQAEILACLGETDQRAGDQESARSHYREAHALYLAVGDPQADVIQARLDTLPNPAPGPDTAPRPAAHDL
jgi:tetratricopeptide (TPR) repeat protein